MKLLLLNECHFQRGGADIVYLNTGRLLLEHGNSVQYFSQKNIQNFHCDQERYFFSKPKTTLQKILNYFYNKEVERNLEQLIQNDRPDIAHVHLIWGVLTPAVLKVLRKHKIPIVHTVHDYIMLCPVNHFLDKDGNICELCRNHKHYKCAIRRCSKGRILESILMTAEMYFRNKHFSPTEYINGFIFVSHFSENKHIEHNSNFNMVPHTVIYNCTKKNNIVESEKGSYYLYFGRLSQEKGVSIMLKAFSECPASILKVVGTGPMSEQLKTMAESLCMTNVEFLGFKTGQELSKLISKSSFVIVPSQCYENNPMTIIEAYSFGKPVIGSDIGGIPEIIVEGDTGYKFKLKDSSNLAQLIAKTETITEDEYSRMSKSCVSFFKKHFSEDIHYNKLINFYDAIIKHNFK